MKKRVPKMAEDKTAIERRRREMRDVECRKHLGYEYEYDRRILLRHPPPFEQIDCVKQTVPDIALVDPAFRYITNAKTHYQCDMLKGKYSGESIDRENPNRLGVCWKTEDDRKCAAFENESGIRNMAGQVYSKRPINKVRRECKKVKGCRWTDVVGLRGRPYEDCVSDASISKQGRFRIPNDWPPDFTNGMIQSYLSEFYENRGKVPAPEVQELISKENRCVPSSTSTKPRLSAAQSIVNLLMTGIALRNPIMANRGILAYHSTGSGKTITAVGVMDAFWDDPERNIIICTSVEGKANNPMFKFHDAALKFFPRFQTEQFVKPNMTEQESLRHVEAAFEDRKVKYMSFAELSHFLMLYRPLQSVVKKGPEAVAMHREWLKNGVIIVDEVHNIFRPLPTQRNENLSVKEFLIKDTPDNEGMKIAILTATPGDTIDDTVELLNMVRDRRKSVIRLPTNFRKLDLSSPEMNVFRRSVQGLVSYFNMNGDSSKFPSMKFEPLHVLPMSHKQYEKYMEEFSQIAKDDIERDFQTLETQNSLQRYLRTPRKYSNSLFTMDEDATTREFSSKVPRLLEMLHKYPNEKHYVYSAFFENRGYGGHGARMIAHLMEKESGYEKMTPDDILRHMNKDGKGFKPTLRPGKRYVMFMAPELVSKHSKVAGVNLTLLLQLFNSPMNAHGEYIHTIVASQGYNEGVDLKGVRHAHLFEPLVTFAMEQQFLGRAVRQCSHQQLDRSKGEWTVTVHRYFSDKPLQMTIYDPTPYEQGIRDQHARKEEARATIDEIKGRRGEEFKRRREDAKEDIRIAEEFVKQYSSKVKAIKKHNLNNPVMIDQIIYDESRDRIRDVLMMQSVLQSVAVDCKVLRKFHENAGLKIKCFEKGS